MVEVLEKELMAEPTLLEQTLGEVAPKIEEAKEIISNVANLGKSVRTVQEITKKVTDATGTLTIALNYDSILSVYNKVKDVIGKKYKIAVDGLKVIIKPEALEPYKNGINWIRRKLDGFRIAYKNELIELGSYAIALPEKEIAYAT